MLDQIKQDGYNCPSLKEFIILNLKNNYLLNTNFKDSGSTSNLDQLLKNEFKFVNPYKSNTFYNYSDGLKYGNSRNIE